MITASALIIRGFIDRRTAMDAALTPIAAAHTMDAEDLHASVAMTTQAYLTPPTGTSLASLTPINTSTPTNTPNSFPNA